MKKSTNVIMLGDTIPSVLYSALAYRQRQYIVDNNAEEVAWFGTGDRLDDGNFLIDRLYVPAQEVTPSQCEAEDEAVADFSEALLADGDCPTRFILWGHSHVKMQTEPSVTDDEQLETYLKYSDTFIRAIYNKYGEERHDIYLKESGICIEYAPAGVYVPPLSAEEEAELALAIKVNVKKRKYAPPKVVQAGQVYGNSSYNGGGAWSPSKSANQKPDIEDAEYWNLYDEALTGDDKAVKKFEKLYGFDPYGFGGGYGY